MKPQYWKKIISIVFAAIFIVSVMPSQSVGQTGTQKADNIYTQQCTVTYNRNDLTITPVNGYDTIRLAGDITYLTTPGQPELPVQQLYVTLPAGMKANKIFVNNVENQNLPGSYIINPAQPPQTMMDAPGAFVAPDSDVYTSSQPWPSHLVTLTDQIELEGKNIAVVEITPLQYIPSEKTLSFASSITFTVEGTIGAIINTPPPQTLSLEPGSYHYVIITQESWMSNFQPLADWRIQRGITTKMVGRDWIYSTYTGTNQAKIRAFIIDAKNTWGTTSFLFGGDVTIIPYYIQTISGFPEGDKLVCCDTYYANTDSNFYTSEVWVGRAPVTTTTEITTFINKIFTYEKNPPTSDYVKKVGLFGFDFDATTHAEDVKIFIDNTYIPANYTMRNVYDSDSGNHHDNVVSAVNAGQQILNHMDHSDYYIMGTGSLNHGWSLTFSDVNAFTNANKQSIIYSVGCWAAAYDYNPCIAEKWVLNPNGGAVAFIGNTRYGWYQVGNPQADSGYYDRLFFQAIFSEHRYTLGDAFTDSKNSFYPNDPYYRYVFSELTLLGDPELRLWNENPEAMVVTHPTTLPIGTSSFTVHVEKTNGVDISGALVVLWKGTEVYLTGTTNANGDVTFTPSPTTAGTMLVTVTKRNFIPYEGSAQVLSGNQPPYVPSSPVPSNGATGVSINTDLSWTGGDPDTGDTVTYDVYFGTVSPPPKVVGNQTGTTYNLPTLAYNTRYYWKIVSWDNHGASRAGSIWSFTTEQPPNNPPNVPSNPNPPNGATAVSINTDLSWVGGDPDPGDTVTYDVYFEPGDSTPEVLVSNGQSGTSYDPGTLSYSTQYYWQIIAEDNHGASTPGPIWTFTTEPIPYYVLNIIIDGNGTVLKNPDQSSYPIGTPVELTAIADPGWHFDHWSGDLEGSDNPDTIIMDDDKTVTAHFVQEHYILTTIAEGAGEVFKNPDLSSYTYGTIVELTAYPVPGFWHFDHWEGDAANIYENPTTITMYEDETVTAYFLPDELTLTIDIIGQGTVLKSPDQQTYHIGDSVELTAVPELGWSFVQWGGDHSGTDNPTTIIISGPMTITATFSEDHYTLAISIEGNGHVDKNPDQPSYTYGIPVELTAVSDPGWHFDHWSGNLEGNDNPDTIIMDGDKTVTAHFLIDNMPPYTPMKPSGIKGGPVGALMQYSTSTTDPEDDQVYYNFSWGDGTYSEWIGPYPSGIKGRALHRWILAGVYDITVQAMDARGSLSMWSESLQVRIVDPFFMPRDGGEMIPLPG